MRKLLTAFAVPALLLGLAQPAQAARAPAWNVDILIKSTSFTYAPGDTYAFQPTFTVKIRYTCPRKVGTAYVNVSPVAQYIVYANEVTCTGRPKILNAFATSTHTDVSRKGKTVVNAVISRESNMGGSTGSNHPITPRDIDAQVVIVRYKALVSQ